MTVVLGMTLGEHDSIRLWASRSEPRACLAISGRGRNCEIRMDRPHLVALRDQLPDMLAGLDRRAEEDAAGDRAEVAAAKATDAAAQALDQAARAEAAGANELAQSLRAAVAEATAKANAVDAAVQAFEDAATDADYAADGLIYIIREAEATLAGPPDPGAVMV